MGNKKAIAFLMVGAVLLIAVASIAFSQANAMPTGTAMSHMGSYGYGNMHQNAAANPYASLQNGFGYMYRMFVGFCRHFW